MLLVAARLVAARKGRKGTLDRRVVFQLTSCSYFLYEFESWYGRGVGDVWEMEGMMIMGR